MDDDQVAVEGGDHHLPHVRSQAHAHQAVREEHLRQGVKVKTTVSDPGPY